MRFFHCEATAGCRSVATTDDGCVGRQNGRDFPIAAGGSTVLYSRRCMASTVGIFQGVTKDGCFCPTARMEILPSLFENPRAISAQPCLANQTISPIGTPSRVLEIV
ncbi:Protein of unknown function [Pyronema omphalodes CBS 100304]|uniref:Uncharacterized protein n=1 Tax=Pyronema omphalodes (strain CBS 100304) TaxID=1076935 RepID=U4LIH1_PYROM|nr:Protein of unknown function [Pyronema omphalodes CBS 100304]